MSVGLEPVGASRRSPWWRTVLVVLVVLAALVGAFVVGQVSARPTSGAAGSAATRVPGPVDVGFSQDMGTHHQQAVLMSTLADSRAGPAVKAVAAAVLASQSQELGALRGWLSLWGMPVESTSPMAWMPSHGPSGGAPGMSMASSPPMPGMATPEELTTLWSKSGPDFDVLYLQLMIRHHQGGVAMAGYASQHADLDVVRQAAQAMRFQQAEEIGQMRALLRTEHAAPLPPP